MITSVLVLRHSVEKHVVEEVKLVLTVMIIHGCNRCNTLSSINRWKEASFSTTNTNLASECKSSQLIAKEKYPKCNGAGRISVWRIIIGYVT